MHWPNARCGGPRGVVECARKAEWSEGRCGSAIVEGYYAKGHARAHVASLGNSRTRGGWGYRAFCAVQRWAAHVSTALDSRRVDAPPAGGEREVGGADPRVPMRVPWGMLVPRSRPRCLSAHAGLRVCHAPACTPLLYTCHTPARRRAQRARGLFLLICRRFTPVSRVLHVRRFTSVSCSFEFMYSSM